MSDLSPEVRQRLLRVARESLTSALRRGQIPNPPPASDDPPTPRNAFVTLTRSGHLRGCTGTLGAERPLTATIAELAVSSAVRDPRFPPMQPEELNDTAIEISVLSEPIESRPEDVEIGRHGVIVERGYRRALLLPQVAIEHRLSREQLLDAVCEKAGLPPHSWREQGTRVLTFTAEVFGEDE